MEQEFVADCLIVGLGCLWQATVEGSGPLHAVLFEVLIGEVAIVGEAFVEAVAEAAAAVEDSGAVVAPDQQEYQARVWVEEMGRWFVAFAVVVAAAAVRVL